MKIDMGLEAVSNWLERNFGWILIGMIISSLASMIGVGILVAKILAKFGIS